MFTNLQFQQALSPTSQDFVWLAEYFDGTFLSEFDIKTKKSNNFYSIKKSNLINFGLIGQKMMFYFQIIGGTFNLNGNLYDFLLEINDNQHNLTSTGLIYNDIITYKDAYTDINPYKVSNVKTNIHQYNFGYKKSLLIQDQNFYVKFICQLPSDDYLKINIKISTDFIGNSNLIILKNKKPHYKTNIDFELNKSINIDWLVN